MKKVLLTLVTLGILTSCHELRIQYDSTKAQAEEVRSIKGFERIELLGSLDVRYEQADSFSVRVKAPEDVIKDVETRVEGNKLVVNMKGNRTFFHIGRSKNDGVIVYVTSPDFLGIELRGSGDFSCLRPLDTDNLDIVLKGSGDIDFNDIICDHVNVSLVGSGDVSVKRVQTLRSQVELVGSGDVLVHFANSGAVESRLTGSGDITLSGSVKSSKYQVRGSGDMHTDELTIRK